MQEVHRIHITHMSKDDLTFANEIMDMLDFRIGEAEAFLDFAKQQGEQIQWRTYEEDFDGRVERFLAI